VHMIAESTKGRKAGLAWSKQVYDRLLFSYGTKQAQAVKEYKGEKVIGPNSESMAANKECPNHTGKFMTEKQGKFGAFYSHTLDDGKWCNGK
ncbi:hypothetical protein KKG52_03825, partial [Patescibacteria group bacterium]|nr:hypothetical protein [Patescibacteria group bacterium]